jgi:hypothetical protein
VYEIVIEQSERLRRHDRHVALPAKSNVVISGTNSDRCVKMYRLRRRCWDGDDSVHAPPLRDRPSSALLSMCGKKLGPPIRKSSRPAAASIESRIASASSRWRFIRHSRWLPKSRWAYSTSRG